MDRAPLAGLSDLLPGSDHAVFRERLASRPAAARLIDSVIDVSSTQGQCSYTSREEDASNDYDPGTTE
jgi:hypothetical protein